MAPIASGRNPQTPVYGTETIANRLAASKKRVAIPKSRSTGLKQGFCSTQFLPGGQGVAIPKSRSTGLKRLSQSVFSALGEVAIPKSRSTGLKPLGAAGSMPSNCVAIPKSRSTGLKQERSTPALTSSWSQSPNPGLRD